MLLQCAVIVRKSQTQWRCCSLTVTRWIISSQFLVCTTSFAHLSSCHLATAFTFSFDSLELEEGKHFFNAVKEGDSVVFACDDENECHLWVMAMYRATGQAHKPTPLMSSLNKNSTISRIQGGIACLLVAILSIHQLNMI